MKQKALKIVIIIAFILNLCDLYTTYRILPGEANPIYLLWESYWTIVIVKVLFSLVLLMMYRRINNPKAKAKEAFFYCLLLMYVILALAVAVVVNYSTPQEYIDQAQQQREDLDIRVEAGDAQAQIEVQEIKQDRALNYAKFVWTGVYAPLILAMFAFWLWEKSYKPK